MIELITQVIIIIKEFIIATKEIIAIIIFAIGYFRERNKREKFEKAYIEVDTKLRITQENIQQVNANLQNSTTIINQAKISEEDIKKLAKEISSATSVSSGTLKINAQPIAFNEALWKSIHKALAESKTYYPLFEAIQEQEKNKEQK